MRRVVFVGTMLALSVFAGWPGGGVKVVQTPEKIDNPQMVYLNDGSVVIAWHEQKGSLTAGHTYCQKLDTTGAVLWDSRGIRVCLHDSLQRPEYHMVTDGKDVWFVWQDCRNDDGDIYAQKIDGATGQRLWGDEGKAVCVKEGLQRRQQATVLYNGSFIASWEDENIDPRNIAAQWFNDNGQPLWESNGMYINRGTDRAYTPFVGPSGNEVVIVWRGAEEGDTIGAYFAKKVDADSNFLWDTLGVLITYRSTPYAECSDGVGGAIVLFSNPGYLAVQRIDSSGQVVWDSGGVKVKKFTLDAPQAFISPYPDPDWTGIISDDSGGCFVWHNFTVQHVDSSGGLNWGSTGKIYWRDDNLTYRLAGTNLCPDGNNGLMVVFDNLEWDAQEWPPYKVQGVRVQRIDADGDMAFDTGGVIIREWNYDSLPGGGNFRLASSSVPGGIITTWVDNRNNPFTSLYAQIVDTTGKIGSGIEEEPLLSVQLPFLEVDESLVSARVALRYSLPAGDVGVLKLYDVVGKVIHTQSVNQREGVVTWNATGFPSGVYFVQLSTSNNERISRKVLILD